ncbi:MAG TPA: YtcA family lipoprotein [Alloacidobacterium sp.]|nr:YtcA family lipoprotein [Alloacidobacterium sp.]
MKRKRSRPVSLSQKSAALVASAGALALLGGCERAPTFSIVGSFFPAWLLCIVAGILLAWGAHWLFTRFEVDKNIQPAILVYPCLAAFFAFTLWLVIFS